jgi:hypothetical protein
MLNGLAFAIDTHNTLGDDRALKWRERRPKSQRPDSSRKHNASGRNRPSRQTQCFTGRFVRSGGDKRLREKGAKKLNHWNSFHDVETSGRRS